MGPKAKKEKAEKIPKEKKEKKKEKVEAEPEGKNIVEIVKDDKDVGIAQKTKASTKSTKVHSGEGAVEEESAGKHVEFKNKEFAKVDDDVELEGPDLSPSKTQMPDENVKSRKLNDGGKQTMPAVKRSARSGRSRVSSIALEIDLDELDVDELDRSQKSDDGDEFVEPRAKSVKATQKTAGASKKRDKDGKPKKEPKEKKEPKAPKEKKEREPKAAKEEKKNDSAKPKKAAAAAPAKDAKPTGKPEKEKEKIMDIADTKKAIEAYLVKHNRPYSIQDILNSFQSTMRKK